MPSTKTRVLALSLACFSGILLLINTLINANKQAEVEAGITSFTEQSRHDSTGVYLSDADRALNRAERFIDEAQFDSAAVYAERAVDLYKDSSAAVVRSLNVQADALERAGHYVESLDLLEQSIQAAVRLEPLNLDYASALHKKGVVLMRLGDYEAALESYEKALQIREHNTEGSVLDLARTINNIGVIYANLGRYEKALDFYLKALKIRRDGLGEKHRDVAQNYNNIGVLYKNTGDYDRAIEYHRRALALREELLGPDHPEVGASYYNLGVVFGMRKEAEPALYFHHESLKVWEIALGEHHPLVHSNLLALGLDYQLEGDSIEALNYGQKVLRLQNKYLEPKNRRIIGSLLGLGQLHFSQGRFEVANQYNAQALDLGIHNWGINHPEVARSYNALAAVERSRGKFTSALSYVEKALSANENIFEASIKEELDIDRYLSTADFLTSLSLKAEIYFDRGQTRVGRERVSDLSLALSVFQDLSAIIQQYRRSFHAEGSKLFLADQVANIYTKAIRTAYLLYEVTGERQFLEILFGFMEKSKASVLLDALYEADARRFSQIPDSIFAREKELRSDLAFYDRKIKGAEIRKVSIEDPLRRKWESRLFTLNEEYSSLLGHLETNFPKYYGLKYRSDDTSINEVRDYVLNENEVLIEYYLDEVHLYIMSITAEDVEIFVLEHDINLEGKVGAFRRAIKRRDRAGFYELGHELYNLLIRPALPAIHDKAKWIVIPHGILNYVPFEALLSKPVKEDNDYVMARYVIHDHELRYNYSASIESTIQRKRANIEMSRDNLWEFDFYGVAPVFEDGLSEDFLSAEVFSGQRRSDPLYSLAESNFRWLQDASDSTQKTVYEQYIDSLLTTSQYPWGFLPQTRQEIKDITRLFKQDYSWKERLFGNRALAILDDDATEFALKSMDLSNRRFIHFATHGVVNEAEPALSGIIMAQDTTGGEDSVLHLGEIYNLELNADLVVLSACETGLGKLVDGEGIVGLTRGFMYAGARSLLVSLWRVEDSSTRKLMKLFYENLLSGMPKAQAARNAKLSLMRLDPVYSIPYYWSGFILVGE